MDQANAMLDLAPSWKADVAPLESAKKRVRRPNQCSWRTMTTLLRQKRPVRQVAAGPAEDQIMGPQQAAGAGPAEMDADADDDGEDDELDES